jgi:hypothetical protein
MRFDFVKEFDWFSTCRDPIVPAPSDMLGRIKEQNPIGERVTAAKVVEKPSIYRAHVSECFLDRNDPRLVGHTGHGFPSYLPSIEASISPQFFA